jgi:lysozyme family protein
VDITRFKKCLDFTMGNEGGFSNDPDDPGGATSRGGVTLAELRRLSAEVHGHDWDKDNNGLIDEKDLALLTDDDLQVAYAKYYNDFMDQFKSEVVAVKLFDFGFNMGPRSAVKILQTAINQVSPAVHVDPDGKLGPHTVLVANALSENALTVQFIAEAVRHYQAIVEHNPSQAKFIKGWTNRANRIPNHG